jgi:hypothetical protein
VKAAVMAEEQAWTIGAAPECDIIVDHPTVSGRHCRITRTADGFLLEDLNSTNGTFVNGTRLSSPLSVTSTDEIKLGPETLLPWESVAPSPPGRQIIRIGRTADNDVVLDYPNVSSNHARIIVENGQATIEDLGSTNGVAIGKPDNLIQSAPLRESDTVYFGSMAFPAAELLHPGQEPAPIASIAGRGSYSAGVMQSPRSIALGALSLVVLAVLAVWLLKENGDETEPPATDFGAADAASTDESINREVALPKPATKIADKPVDAVYSVLVQNQGTERLLHVGTAWAVGEHQLVTSGIVARYLKKYSTDIAAIRVRSASLEKVFDVTDSTVHPEFKKAEAAIKAPVEAAQQKRQQLDDVQEAENPPSKEDLEKLVNELIDAEEKVFLAGEKMVFSDVGLLTVAETLPFVLQIKPQSQELAVQTKTTLYGVPFNPESMATMGPRKPTKLEGRLMRVVRPLDESGSPLRRLLVSSPADHHAQQWRGGPILDDRGFVVGIYVRPAQPIDPEKPVTGESFDAVLVERLQQLPIDFPEAKK